MKYNTNYAFGGNNESGIRSRQVLVWRGLISIVLSVINSGLNNYYGIDRIPVCRGSGMYRLHCIDFYDIDNVLYWFKYIYIYIFIYVVKTHLCSTEAIDNVGLYNDVVIRAYNTDVLVY